jgi:hypothetical protein
MSTSKTKTRKAGLKPREFNKWENEFSRQRSLQWPAAWADEQITIIGNMI